MYQLLNANGCQLQGIKFTTSSVSNHSEISLCIQVPFIIARCTHSTYYKTLQHALGISKLLACLCLCAPLDSCFPLYKNMLNEMCEIVKQEMKDMGGDKLGLWTRAVTA